MNAFLRTLAGFAILSTVVALHPWGSQSQAQSAAAVAVPEPAAEVVAKTVKRSVEAWLKGRHKVDSVSKTPMPGIVEVRLGKDLLYADEKGGFAIVDGQMVNLKTGANLTASRMETLQAIDFSKLPLELASKVVRGDGGKGKRTIAVFEDPYCSYCRKFRNVLFEMDNITVYTFFYPILRPESTTVSANAWCAKDREAAWDDWMLANKEPPQAPAGCNFPKDKILALGQSLGVQATPTIFIQSGRRFQGALSKEQMEAVLR
ncbi:MAG: DsbC family protein [Betaproteobacteria bacterium]|nr:DsbC family protein [Betaproteobacteria bacterium]